MNDALLPNKKTNLKMAILRLHEDFMSMKPIERFSGILTNSRHKSLAHFDKWMATSHLIFNIS